MLSSLHASILHLCYNKNNSGKSGSRKRVWGGVFIFLLIAGNLVAKDRHPNLHKELMPPPTAASDNYNTVRGVAVNANVLTNDDPNGGGPLTVQTTPVSNVTNGTLTLRADGSFTYMPNPNFFGVDRFTYRVCDRNGSCSNGDVMIDVSPAKADLVLTQKTNLDTGIVGEPLIYTVTLTNNGPSPVYTNEVFYVLEQAPNGYQLISMTPSEGTLDASGRWTGVDLPAGKSVTITVNGIIRPDYNQPTITNIITIQPPNNVIVNTTPTGQITTPVMIAADLAVTKTDGTDYYTPGSPVTYTIIATNNGKSNVQRVLIQDIIPAGINVASWTATASGGASISNSSGNTSIYQQANMPSGSQVTFKLTLDIPAGFTDVLKNTVTVQSLDPVADPIPGNNSATDIDSLKVNDRLGMVKTGPASAFAGGAISYKLVVSNTGTSNVLNAVITDNIDPRITNVTYTVATTGAATTTATSGSGSPVRVTGNLPVGANNTIVITINGTIAGDATGQIFNGALVTTSSGKQFESNNVLTTLQTKTGLNIVKTGPAGGTVIAGDTISYKIIVTNAGPSNDPKVDITDLVPSVITNVSWTAVARGSATITPGAPSGGSGNSVSTSAAIPAGTANAIEITINGRVLPGAIGNINNTATAKSTAGGQVDANNLTRIDTKPNIVVVKSGPVQVNAGEAISYTIVYRNNGLSDGKLVLLTDAVPSLISNVKWTSVVNGKATIASGATGTGNQVRLFADLPAGDNNSVTVNITGTVSPGFQGNITNQASAELEGIPVFNSNQVVTKVVNSPKLLITKSGPASVTAGGVITYQLFVTNSGPSNAYGIRIRDVVPSQIRQPLLTVAAEGNSVVTDNTMQGSVATVTGNIDAGPGNRIVVTIRGTVDPAFTGTFRNISSAATTTDSTNSNEVVTTVDNKAVLQISKSGPAQTSGGNAIAYRILITNTGISDAVGMTMNDVVPAGINNVSWTATPLGTATITGNAAGTGSNIQVTGTIPAGTANQIQVDVKGTISPAFAGLMQNKATAVLPGKPAVSDSVSTTVLKLANISISKTGPARVPAGNNVVYTLLVSNSGPSDAPGTVISDVVPAQLTNISWTAVAANGATIISGATGNTDTVVVRANIPAGNARVTVTITGKTDPGFTGIIQNLAFANPGVDIIPSQLVNTEVYASPALHVAKIGPAALNAGEKINYLVTVTNSGPSNATGVTINDIIPASIVNASWTAIASGAATVDSGTTGNGNTVKTRVSIPAGTVNKIVISVTGTVSPAFTGTIKNAANAVIGSEPPVLSDSVVTVVKSHPVLVVKKIGPDTASAGGTIQYLLSLQNKGTSDARQINFTDTVPVGITNVKWTTLASGNAIITAGATGTGNIVKYTADIPAGNLNIIAISITGTIAPGFTGTLQNRASGIIAGIDTAYSNLVNTAVKSVPGLTLSKQGPDFITSGAAVNYTLLLTNAGPSDAAQVSIADVIPADIINTKWTATTAGTAVISTGATGTGNNLLVTGNVPAGAGNYIRVLISGKLNTASTAGTITNIASAQIPGGTVFRDTVVSQVEIFPGIRLVKNAPDTIRSGAAILYSIHVTNIGPSNGKGIVLTDVIPAAILNATWTATTTGNGTTVSQANGAGNVNITADIPADSTAAVDIRIAGTVDPNFAGDSIQNTAAAQVPGVGNLSYTVTTHVIHDAVLSISKTGPATSNAGKVITYHLSVANSGPSSAIGALITDTIASRILNPVWTVVNTGGATTSVTNGTGNVNVTATIPAGTGRVDITITGTLSPTLVDTTIVNTAYAKLPAGYINNVPVSSSVQTVIRNEVDLGIVKSGPSSKVAGQSIAYHLIVTNKGPADVVGGLITDTIPAAVTNITATVTTTGAATATLQPIAGNRVAVTVNIPAGLANYVVVNINGIVDPSTLPGPIKNTAWIEPPAGSHETLPVNNSSSITTEITNETGVIISKAGPASLKVGDPISYTIEVANAGVSNATGVLITDTIPLGIDNISHSISVQGGSGGTTYTDQGTDPRRINVLANIDGTAAGSGKIVIIVNGTVAQNAPALLLNRAVADTKFATVTTQIDNTVDLDISKQAPQQLNAGEQITYNIVVTNNGPANVTGAVITDLIPATILSPVWTATASGGVTVSNSSGAGDIHLTADLPANSGMLIISVTGKVDPAATGSITNTATAVPPAGVTDPTPATASATTVIRNKSNLNIVKSGPNVVASGGTINYSLLVTNLGPSDAKGLDIADLVPGTIEGVTWTSSAGNGAVITGGGSGSGNNEQVFADMIVGGRVTVNISGKVPVDFTGLLSNLGEIDDSTGPIKRSNVVHTQVLFSTSVKVSKTGPATVKAGEAISYHVLVTNDGPSEALGLKIRDSLPVPLKNVRWTATTNGAALITQGGPSGTSSLISLVADLPPGGNNSIDIAVTGIADSAATGIIKNYATAVNQVGVVTTSDTIVTGILSNPHIRVEKNGPDTVAAGGSFQYAIHVYNDGASAATGVHIRDLLPAVLTNVTWSATAEGTGVINGGNLINQPGNPDFIADIPAGVANGIRVVVNAQTAPSATGAFVNSATALLSATDSVVSNQVNTVIVQQPGVTIRKSGPTNANAGTSLEYQVIIGNNGPSNATGVVISDLVSDTLKQVSWSATATGSAVINGGNITNRPGDVLLTADIPAGDSSQVIIRITGIIDSSFTGQIRNTAVASALRSNEVITTVTRKAQILLTKQGPATIAAGRDIQYTIEVSNLGPSNTDTVQIHDIVPAPIRNVAWFAYVNGGATISGVNLDTSHLINVKGWIPAGSANKIQVVVYGVVDPMFTGVIKNVATADTAGIPAAADSVITTVTKLARLQISKTGPSNAAAGTPIFYSVRLLNSGPSFAGNVNLLDIIPVEIQPVQWQATAGGSSLINGLKTLSGTNSGITFKTDIYPGDSNAITLTVNGMISASFTGTLRNTAIFTDTSGVTDSAAVNTNVTASTALTLTKIGPATAVAGGDVSYRITVQNNGPSDAKQVAIADIVPADILVSNWIAEERGAAFISGNKTGTGNNVQVTADIAAGQTNAVVITVNGKVSPQTTATEVRNIATVSSNGQPAAADTVITAISHQADISVSKTGTSIVVAGEKIQYNIRIGNTGPSDAKGLIIADVLPAGLTNATWTAVPTGAGVVVSAATGTGNVNLTADIPAAAGNEINITVNATVAADLTTTILKNFATLTNPGQPTLADSVITVVRKVTAVKIIKTGYSQAIAGGVINYALVITNDGPSLARDVSIRDILPQVIGNATYTVTVLGGATATVNNGTGNIDFKADIPAGTGVVSVAIAGRVDPATNFSSITNTAYADSASSTLPTAILRVTDLDIVKSGPANATAGGSIAYQLVITNKGFSDVTGAVIEDIIPAAVQNAQVVWSTTGNAVVTLQSLQNNVLRATANIPAGANHSVIANITGTINPAFDGISIFNSATVKTPPEEAEINVSNNTSTVTTAIDTSTGIHVSKAGPASVNIGDTIHYRIELSNSGAATATPVNITDNVPAEISTVSWTATVQGGSGSTTISKTSGTGNNIALQATLAGTAAGGGTVVILVKGIVTPAAGTTIKNVVTAEYNGSKNSEFTTAVNRTADLLVTKNAPAALNAGDSIHYIITASNRGPADVTGATLTDNIPASVLRPVWRVVATGGAASSVSSGSGNALQLTLNIPVNTGLVTIYVDGVVAASQRGTISNIVTLDPPAGITDPTKAIALANTLVGTPNSSNLQIVKSGPVQLNAGDSITYQLDITNIGNTVLTGVQIHDVLPADIEGISWQAIPVSNSAVGKGTTGNGPTLDVEGDLLLNGLISIFVKGKVKDGFNGVLTNTANATLSGNVINSNTILTLVNQVPAAVNLAILKTGPATAIYNGNITYTITATNNGPVAANGAIITDALPPALQNPQVTVSGTTGGAGGVTALVSGNNVGAVIGTFPVGATAVLTVTAKVNGLGNISNTAEIIPPAGTIETDNTDNFSTATTIVTGEVPLHITKTAVTAGPYVVDQQIRYRITVNNSSTLNISGVTMTDLLPPGGITSAPVIIPPVVGAAIYQAAANRISWTIAVLPAGATVALEYDVRVLKEGSLVNKAVVGALRQGEGLSVTPDSTTHTITATAMADLAIQKVMKSPAANLKVGDKPGFTITLNNQGPNTARDITVTDNLLPNLDMLADYTVSTGQVVIAAGNHAFTWKLDSLASGQTATMTFNTRVTGTGTIYNTATVAAVTADPDLRNNTAKTTEQTTSGDDIYIPNIITPNGDGKNDYFFIPGLDKFPGSSLFIYNRWGNSVYQSKDYSNKWDGNGLNEGTYYYILKLNTPQGTRDYKGWVEILR
ncbi:T9SS type B sorting domain-containing protein [Chitinophaga arvensicola]|uniref:Conserved repeat domain-containing protein/gliding motility-associated C-terminal domain-containing protein n=1 Tax=Chitinophaga arvensicola TaxID=29529 RepID=A0A1I0SB94_9BACT|nr:gliding motility-associated C-terminal domain-containing protein [Chitinophaga arvensicola]SEW53852.1 conserved repeat domain-containing protein/gliding motility-associated C-terminal domain-containing protein [Chitinophaga arvensicola]